MDILIDETDAGKNIRELLRRDMGYSSGMLKKLKFTEGGILVNGKFVTVRYVLQKDDVLSLACEDTEEDTSPYIIPVDLPIGIAYEDGQVTVVDKPPFMPAHPSLGHRKDTVANTLAYRYRDKTYVFRPVNRLDRDTSGLMLTANTRLGAYQLYKAMIGGMIEKAYVAILDKPMARDEGVLFSYMGRCEDSIVMRRIVTKGTEGAKPAVTAYKTLIKTEKHTVVLATPVTGRTHQLRLHFASNGCSITGDTMYGTESPLISRHALHSAYTAFPHPITKEIITLISPIPADMRAVIGNEAAEDIENKLITEAKLLEKMKNEYTKNSDPV